MTLHLQSGADMAEKEVSSPWPAHTCSEPCRGSSICAIARWKKQSTHQTIKSKVSIIITSSRVFPMPLGPVLQTYKENSIPGEYAG